MKRFDVVTLLLTLAALASIGVATVASLDGAYGERLCSCVEAGPLKEVQE